ncbi:MAG: hypothetical protein RLN60_00955 [Phycisphaerales bacterium]
MTDFDPKNPPITLPLGPILAKGFSVWALIGAGGFGALMLAHPASAPEVAAGASVSWFAALACLLAARPWSAKPVQAWGAILVLMQGISVLLVIAGTLALLYSSPLSDPLALTLTEVVSFIASWAVIARAYQLQSSAAQRGGASSEIADQPTDSV